MFFGKNIKYLRKKANLKQDEMKAGTGIGGGTWSNYELENTEPDLASLAKISKFFRVSVDDLLNIDIEIAAVKGNLISKGEVLENDQNRKLKGNPKGNPNSHFPLTVVHDDSPGTGAKGLIPITDISVAAGSGVFNQDYVDNVDFLRLPQSLLKKGASYIAVGIKGPSMSPTLQDGGYVIIRLLDKGEWPKMQDERIFVVSDLEGKSYLKRVKNRFKQGFIVLKSDNPDQASYPNFNLKAEEINSIWYVEWYFTAKMPNIHDQFYTRLQKLEDKVDDWMISQTKMNRQLK